MAKKVKSDFGKRRKRTKAGDERRKPGRHRWKRQRSNKGSGSNNTRLEVALLCASAGLSVVPLHGVKGGLCTCGNKDCEQPGRHPRTKNGLKDATTDPEKIKQMGERWPKAKFAIALSPELVAVVVEGKAGRKELEKLEESK